MLRNILSPAAVAVTAALLPIAAHAQVDYGYGTNAGGSSYSAEGIFLIVFWVLILIMAFFIVMGMISFATAYGDSEKAKKGTRRMLYAALALVVAIIVRVLPTAF